MTRHSPTAEKLLLHGVAGPIEALLESPPGAGNDVIAIC
jgi:hypothetical protein